MAPAARPLVSVVTPSFNQGGFVERTLRSVLCQDYPGVEYLVIDGLSSDATGDILERYRDSIDVLVREADGGLADALDKGFGRAGGDVLAYLNSDDCYAGPSVISRVVEYFRRRPDVDVLFGRRVIVDESGRFVSRWPYLPFDAAVLRRVDFIPQECCFWRRSAWQRAGGFIDRGLGFAVDYELWLRFLACGERFLAVDDAFGLFREHAGQKSQARWREEGWPEVRTIQRRYGLEVAEAEQRASFDRLAFGTGPRRQLRRLWHALGDRFARRAARGRALDDWSADWPVRGPRRPARSA
jgi:glycosyltransferase involved in cell wall biosynthesis